MLNFVCDSWIWVGTYCFIFYFYVIFGFRPESSYFEAESLFEAVLLSKKNFYDIISMGKYIDFK